MITWWYIGLHAQNLGKYILSIFCFITLNNFPPQNIGHAALEALNDFQANVLAKELQAWCVFVARRWVHHILLIHYIFSKGNPFTYSKCYMEQLVNIWYVHSFYSCVGSNMSLITVPHMQWNRRNPPCRSWPSVRTVQVSFLPLGKQWKVRYLTSVWFCVCLCPLSPVRARSCTF